MPGTSVLHFGVMEIAEEMFLGGWSFVVNVVLGLMLLAFSTICCKSWLLPATMVLLRRKMDVVETAKLVKFRMQHVVLLCKSSKSLVLVLWRMSYFALQAWEWVFFQKLSCVGTVTGAAGAVVVVFSSVLLFSRILAVAVVFVNVGIGVKTAWP